MNTKTLALIAAALAVAAGIWLLAASFHPSLEEPSIAVLNFDPPGLMYGLVVLRAGPGREYDRIGFLEPGTSARAIARDAAGGWLLLDDPQGWVSLASVEITENVDTLPESDVRVTPPSIPIVSVLNPADGAAVDRRMGPGEVFPTIDLLEPGESSTAMAQDPSGRWLLVEPGGWVPVALVRVDGDLHALPTLDVGD